MRGWDYGASDGDGHVHGTGTLISREGGGLYRVEFLSQILCEFLVRNLFGVFKNLHGRPLLICTVPKDLVNKN